MPSEEKEAGKPATKNTREKILAFEEIGIWTVMREVNSKALWMLPTGMPDIMNFRKEFFAMLPFLRRFIYECYSVSPWMMTVYLTSSLWFSIEESINMYFSGRLLNLIQNGVTNRHFDGRAMIITVIGRLAFTLASTLVSSYRHKTAYILATRVRYLFEMRVIAANLRLDMPAFEETANPEKINRFMGHYNDGAWSRFEAVVSKIRVVTSIVSQLSLLYGFLSSQPGGYWFATVCVVQAFVETCSYSSIWDTSSYVWDSNPHYRRMNSLLSMVTNATHRIEILSDVLTDYVQREWFKARTSLGDASDEYPDRLKRTNRPLLLKFADAALADLPMIFYALQVFRRPESFSITSITLMQQISTNLTWTLYDIIRDSRSTHQVFQEIKELYDIGNIPNKLKDGDLKYLDAVPESRGVEIKFENVSFTYPTTKDEVIKNVSFTIGNGQTVVIVGVNGSGKSTLLKLFNRLYDPTSGTIFIDGVPLSSFVAADVRRSMAMLYQTYTHFPLSIRENIALGIPDEDQDVDSLDEKQRSIRNDRIMEAVRLGGSLELINKQALGIDTVLHPRVHSFSSAITEAGQEFKDKVTQLKKQAEVSAGQWQRLALSRLFYRSFQERIRLVAVDEPSASLDPKMEYELFERLRSLSTAQGKTMVYVTHRFGYLTKHADLILVMHKGELVEQGRHNDLLAKDGEYAKLYKLQAEAFTPDEGVTDAAL